MNVILGIGWGHDSSICYINNGKVICAIEEEKISRKKSENGFPVKSLELILKTYNINPSEVSVIAVTDRLYNSKSWFGIAYAMTKMRFIKVFENLIRVIFHILGFRINISEKNKFYFEWWIRKYYKFSNAKIIYFDHHLCHAAGAHCTANYRPDIIITCDGRGEDSSFNAYKITKSNQIELFHSNNFNVSIGQLYSVVTDFLGFIPNRHEGKIMGLSARGKSTFLADNMTELFYYNSKDQLKRKPNENEYKNFVIPKFLHLKLSTSLNETGYRYAKNSLWLRKWLEINSRDYSIEDIAFAVQKTTEKVVLEEISKIIEKSGITSSRLALSGGVFANVVLNKKILELPKVQDVFIQPAMSDAGLSLGASFLASKDINSESEFNLTDTYLGLDVKPNFEDLIPKIKDEFEVVSCTNIYDKISDLLIKNKIIGLFNGRNEFGPRALGNRSIIASANSDDMHIMLNERLKRNDFMPFAPSILYEVAKEYLEDYNNDIIAAEYMTMTFKVKPSIKEKIKAAVHLDGTVRPHIVKDDKNKHFYMILKSYYKKTGIGAVLNPSFNVHEEPIVSNYHSALSALRDKRIDFLNIGNYLLFEKEK